MAFGRCSESDRSTWLPYRPDQPHQTGGRACGRCRPPFVNSMPSRIIAEKISGGVIGWNRAEGRSRCLKRIARRRQTVDDVCGACSMMGNAAAQPRQCRSQTAAAASAGNQRFREIRRAALHRAQRISAEPTDRPDRGPGQPVSRYAELDDVAVRRWKTALSASSTSLPASWQQSISQDRAPAEGRPSRRP